MADESADAAGLLAGIATAYPLLCQAVLRDARAELRRVALGAGEVLCRQGDPADSLYFLITGRLRVSVARDAGEPHVSEVAPGRPVGELGVLAGARRSATVTAAADSVLVRLPKAAFERIAERSPEAVGQLAEVVRRRIRRDHLAEVLSRRFGPIDAEMLRAVEDQATWVHLRSGDVLMRQGDEADCIYLVISGRLCAVAADAAGGEKLLNEIARAECIGEIGLLAGEARTATVRAIRDSELVRLPKSAFEAIAQRHPLVMTSIARTLIGRLRAAERRAPGLSPARPVTNLALLPAGPNVPLGVFAERLVAALAFAGPVLHLCSRRLDGMVGMGGAAQMAEDNPQNCRLAAWLDDQEARCRFVVYEADASVSAWTMRCVRQADQVLIVGEGGADPAPGAAEETVCARDDAAAVRRTLVLLHPDGSRLPTGTRRWLGLRGLADHYHVRMDSDADAKRLARCLAGRGVGVALGGGGARGLSHIGVLRALAEADVPVDRIAGTSMGAIIGAAGAMGMTHEALLETGRKIFMEAKPHKEYTFPLFSLIRSRKLDDALRLPFGDTFIEDMWLPYFCVSCDLTAGRARIHADGAVWRATRASGSLPGIFLPVIERGRLLVDGGVLNNLPGDVMQQRFGGPVIAVCPSPPEDLHVRRDEFPAPWRGLWGRLAPFAEAPDLPNILDILVRTIVVGSIPRAEQVQRDAAFLLRPPVERYGMLEFEAMAEIVETGYRYAMQEIEAWKKTARYGELIGACP